MEKLLIEGGQALSGSVIISGAKNAALPILISSILTAEECTYTNVPKLRDIGITCQLLEQFGTQVSSTENTVVINAGTINSTVAPYD